jgi:hypothetical protein
MCVYVRVCVCARARERVRVSQYRKRTSHCGTGRSLCSPAAPVREAVGAQHSQQPAIEHILKSQCPSIFTIEIHHVEDFCV